MTTGTQAYTVSESGNVIEFGSPGWLVLQLWIDGNDLNLTLRNMYQKEHHGIGLEVFDETGKRLTGVFSSSASYEIGASATTPDLTVDTFKNPYTSTDMGIIKTISRYADGPRVLTIALIAIGGKYARVEIEGPGRFEIVSATHGTSAFMYASQDFDSELGVRVNAGSAGARANVNATKSVTINNTLIALMLPSVSLTPFGDGPDSFNQLYVDGPDESFECPCRFFEGYGEGRAGPGTYTIRFGSARAGIPPQYEPHIFGADIKFPPASP